MADIEYRGRNARVRIEGDELAFSKGRRIARAVAGPDDWRIPIACIREVVFKDAKFAAGLLHLVIADAESPTASVWGLADKPWTIEFQAGKQAKSMRALRDALEERIRRNRAEGIDPLTARRPYVDPAGAEELRAAKQSILGDSLIRQSSPEATPDDLIASARQCPSYAEFWTDLETLGSRLDEGEVLKLVVLGSMSAAPVLIGVTDRRLIVHRDGPTLRLRDEMPMPAQVSWRSGLIGGALVFRSGTRELEFASLSDLSADAIMTAVR